MSGTSIRGGDVPTSRYCATGLPGACPVGREGAHRIYNPTDEPARVLIVSTMKAPEINEMLEDGSFWVRDYAPGPTPDDPTLDLPGLRPADG